MHRAADMTITMSYDPVLWSPLALGFYFIVFAIIHSLLASEPVKQAALKRIPRGRRWYRLFYNFVAVTTSAPLIALLIVLPDRTIYLIPAPWMYLMVCVQVGGVAGLLLALRQIGIAKFLGISKILDEGRGLKVSGIFCRVRNPIFLFGLIIIWATPFMSANLLVLDILVTIYFYVGSLHEEMRMHRDIGPEYDRYRRTVPRFIPRPGRCYLPERR